MSYKAIVSGHIWSDKVIGKDIEILTIIHNDSDYTDIFSDVDHALLEQIDIGDSEDYYFIAIIESEFVEYRNWEGIEYDVEHVVTEIKLIVDIETIQ